MSYDGTIPSTEEEEEEELAPVVAVTEVETETAVQEEEEEGMAEKIQTHIILHLCPNLNLAHVQCNSLLFKKLLTDLDL